MNPTLESLVEECQGTNTTPQAFVDMFLFGDCPAEGYPPEATPSKSPMHRERNELTLPMIAIDKTGSVAQLKFVVRSNLSVDMYEVEIFNMKYFTQYKKQVEQALNLKLPTIDSPNTTEKIWRSDVVEWRKLYPQIT